MIIHDFYFNEENENLYVEFSTKEDGDKFYRSLELDFKDIQFYSPIIISIKEVNEIDEDFIIELLVEYFKNNDLPEEEIL